MLITQPHQCKKTSQSRTCALCHGKTARTTTDAVMPQQKQRLAEMRTSGEDKGHLGFAERALVRPTAAGARGVWVPTKKRPFRPLFISMRSRKPISYPPPSSG